MLFADEGVSTLALRHFALGDDHADRHRLMLPADGLNLEQLERDLILQALTKADGNQTRAGALLGLNRDQMRYRVKKFGLTLPT